MARVLVVFDTKNGSTAEVAEAVTERLRDHGLLVDTALAKRSLNLVDWDGIVVGAPIYSGHWLNGGHRILKQLARIAAGQRPPVAIFALGPRQEEGPENWMRPREQFERALGRHPSIAPIATALLGCADPPKKKYRDVRDWVAIAAWADQVADLLVEKVA